MSKVFVALAVSVDGYVTGRDPGAGRGLGDGTMLFDWYFDGDTPSVVFADFRLSAASAGYFDRYASRIGAVVTGRRTYEIAGGWNGGGPLPGTPVFVLSHRPPPGTASGDRRQTFVAGAVAEAIAQAQDAAGERNVALQGSAAVQQALAAGLLDVLALELVPVLLGGGVRLLDGSSHALKRIEVVDAPGVTHLVYEVAGP
jgi:dihydrofolate reductase